MHPSNNQKAIFIAEHNIDTIIDCLCTQIQNQQSLIDMYRAMIRRLENDISDLRDKYEPGTKEADLDE